MKQDKATGKFVHFLQLDTWSGDLNTDFTLGDCMFGAVKLTKNADPDKYGYSGYGIGFDASSHYSNDELDKLLLFLI